MGLYFLPFVLLLSAEAGIDPLSWGLFVHALIIFSLFFRLHNPPVWNPLWMGKFKEILLAESS